MSKPTTEEIGVKRLAAPMGLSEWLCTNGEIYYSEKSARARQTGLNKRKGRE